MMGRPTTEPNRFTTETQHPGAGSDRVFRGGDWYFYVMLCRSAIRGSDSPDFATVRIGFRPVRSAN